MKTCDDVTQTVATFIVQKILRDDVGLAYMCATAQRFYAVSQALHTMTLEKPSVRLLRHIIRCYLRLSDNSRACDALKSCLPDILRDMEFLNCLQVDQTTFRWLTQLLHNVDNTGNVNRMP